MIPSSFPTITGSVASVSISGIVTESMSQQEVDEVTSQLAEIYGVDVNDIETTVDYVTSGTLDVTIPEDVSESEAIEVLQESISDVLGVHVKDVTVLIEDDGSVTYSIHGASVDEVEAIQNIASQDDFASQITENLVESDSDVVVEAATSNEEIEVVISATLDTSDATGTIDVNDGVSDLTQELGLSESKVESNFEDISESQKNLKITHKYKLLRS